MIGRAHRELTLDSVTRKCSRCKIEFALAGITLCSECNLYQEGNG